jgi:flavin-dependent dehydrogenase
MSSLIPKSLLDRFNSWVKSIREQSEKRSRLQIWLAVGGGLTVIVVIGKILALRRRKRLSPLLKENKPFQLVKNNTNAAENEYDVIIAGGGVSGTTCAYYLAKKGLDVLVLEKLEEEQADTSVDDVIPMRAQKILSEVGILKACNGNAVEKTTLVCSKATSTYSNVHDTTGTVYKNAMIIKGSLLRNNLIAAAKKVGVTYKEGHTVDKTKYSPVDKMWTIEVVQGESRHHFKSRAAVFADGANGKLGKEQRLVRTEPDSVRSHAIIKQKNMDVDQIVVFSKSISPGYCSLVKYSDGDVGFTTTLLPGNSRAQLKDIQDLHRSCATEETVIRDVLGGDAGDQDLSINLLRTGGIDKTFKDNLLLIGDAAGLVDPLTGSSVAYALESAKIAAEVLYECFQVGNLTDRNLRRYQERWQLAFEDSFHWSTKIRGWTLSYPVLIDAAVSLTKKRGKIFASELSQVLLGARSKGWFLRPDVAFFFLLEVVRLSWFK